MAALGERDQIGTQCRANHDHGCRVQGHGDCHHAPQGGDCVAVRLLVSVHYFSFRCDPQVVWGSVNKYMPKSFVGPMLACGVWRVVGGTKGIGGVVCFWGCVCACACVFGDGAVRVCGWGG